MRPDTFFKRLARKACMKDRVLTSAEQFNERQG